jgi:hypothetical protein
MGFSSEWFKIEKRELQAHLWKGVKESPLYGSVGSSLLTATFHAGRVVIRAKKAGKLELHTSIVRANKKGVNNCRCGRSVLAP